MKITIDNMKEYEPLVKKAIKINKRYRKTIESLFNNEEVTVNIVLSIEGGIITNDLMRLSELVGWISKHDFETSLEIMLESIKKSAIKQYALKYREHSNAVNKTTH